MSESNSEMMGLSEYSLQDNDQLCFIHIPKTAGTTLTSILDSKFSRDEICPEVFLRKLQDYSPEQLAAYRLFRGHFSYDIGRCLPRSPHMITMLRDPVERVISAYEFMKTCIIIHPQAAITQQKARSLPLKDYIRDPAISGVINGQTRQIAGRAWRGDVRSVETDWLHGAQEHLDSFAFVGLTEQFNESMALLNYTFGWSPLQQIQRLMVGSKRLKREQLTAEELEIILEYNQLDVALYSYAKTLFERRYQTMLTRLERYGPALSSTEKSTTREDDAQQQQLEHHYEACFIQAHPAPMCQLTFTFDQGFSGSGWHGWEGEGRHLPFRWTGPGTEATLDFPPLVPDKYVVELRVINAVTPEVLSSLQLRINQTPLHLISLYCDEDTAVLRGSIPETAVIDAPFTRLTFSVGQTRSLQSANPTVADRRSVGVAIDLVQIYPTSKGSAKDPAKGSAKDPAEGSAKGSMVAKTGDRPVIDTTAFLFEDAPRPWQEVEAFLRQHLLPNETLFAPNLFRARFESAMPSEGTIPPGRIANYGAAQVDPTTYQWAVLHKGMQSETGPLFLQLLLSPFAPVLANAVFIVFSTRSDIPRLPYSSPHVRYAYTGYVKHQAAQSIATLTQTIRQYSKYAAKQLPGVARLRRLVAQIAQQKR